MVGICSGCSVTGAARLLLVIFSASVISHGDAVIRAVTNPSALTGSNPIREKFHFPASMETTIRDWSEGDEREKSKVNRESDIFVEEWCIVLWCEKKKKRRKKGKLKGREDKERKE